MNENATYQWNETVDITIRGARVDHHADGELWVQVPGAKAGSLVPLTDAVRVLVTQPADGPAQPGDVWKDGTGDRWMAFEKRTIPIVGRVEVFLTNGFSERSLRGLCEDYAPLTLEYRAPAPVMNGTSCEDITGENEPAVDPRCDCEEMGRNCPIHRNGAAIAERQDAAAEVTR